MQKNDYRRSIIMLRPMRSGCSGHARLERRTLMGDLFLNAGVPSASANLRLTLSGCKRGKWFAADAGDLHTDSRGQVAGRFHFDPRNISGRDLEDYSVVLVTEPGDTDIDILLAGSLKGANVDWAAMRDAVREIYLPADETVLTLSEQPAPSQTDTAPAALPEENAFMAENTNMPIQPKAAENSRSVPITPLPDPGEGPAIPDFPGSGGSVPITPLPDPGEGPAIPDFPGSGGSVPITPLPDPGEGPAIPDFPGSGGSVPITPLPNPGEGPAIPDFPGSSGSVPITPLPDPGEGPAIPDFPTWPEKEACCNNSPALPQIEGYIFVRLPSPSGCGFPCVAIGLRTESGCVTGVCYAVPGRWQPEPPAGLEDYTWLGKGAFGWWIDCLDICTLAPSPATCIQPRNDEN